MMPSLTCREKHISAAFRISLEDLKNHHYIRCKGIRKNSANKLVSNSRLTIPQFSVWIKTCGEQNGEVDGSVCGKEFIEESDMNTSLINAKNKCSLRVQKSHIISICQTKENEEKIAVEGRLDFHAQHTVRSCFAEGF